MTKNERDAARARHEDLKDLISALVIKHVLKGGI